jgi:hypothetical protein
MTTCKICDKQLKSAAALAGHVGAAHKMSVQEYIVLTEYNGNAPKCKACENAPSFIRGENKFRTYCKEHANLGRAEWSKENMPFDPGWKRGLTKETNSSIRSHSEKMKGEQNHFYKNMPRHIIEKAAEARKTKCLLGNERFIERAQEKFKDRYDYSEIEYAHSKDKIKILCKEHNYFFFQRPNDHLSGYIGCPKCSGSGFSKAEKEVVEWLRDVYDGEIAENTRSIIAPKELDIYLPEKNFAIEYNGLYWHSGERIDKRTHLDKTISCREKGIKLFHIFSDEWEYKRDIVKSMILHRLGMSMGIVYARKCEVRKVEKEQGREFFEKCHISGDNRASAYFGLFYGDRLRACLSLKKPIQKKYKNSIEIARFATGLYTSVPGGFSKLFKVAKEWAKSNGFQNILTYADMRFGEGEVYNKEFKLVGSTPVDYWYTDGDTREFRFKYRASAGLTERQVAEKNNVWPVYGCGSKIYLLSIA